MIYEWYSGSDKSMRVAEQLNKVNDPGSELSDDEQIAVLRELLRIEQDRNWRGCLHALMGFRHQEGKREEDAVAAYTEALKEFDPLAGNLRDVIQHYCEALYGMINLRYIKTGEFEKIAEYSSIIMAHMDEVIFLGHPKSMVYAYQSQAFNILGNKTSVPCFHSLALASALRAHHLAPDDPLFLEGLMYCYFHHRDKQHLILTYEMFERVSERGEVQDRVRQFVRERAGEIGVKVTKDGRLHA